MPRHFAEQSTIASVLPTPDVSSSVGEISNSSPSWHLQRRARTEHHHRMLEKETLRDGFGAFLSEVDDSHQNALGDASKRHFPQTETQERKWRPSLAGVREAERNRHATGKRFLADPVANVGVEVDDLPRGKKHVPPSQTGQLQAEMDVFEIRLGKVKDANGASFAEKRCDEGHAFVGLAQRKHLSKPDRNGIPQIVPGDKLYTAVEFSTDFKFSEPHRCGLEPIGKTFVAQRQYHEKETVRQYRKDVADVAALPKYPKANGGGGRDGNHAATGNSAPTAAAAAAPAAKGAHKR